MKGSALKETVVEAIEMAQQEEALAKTSLVTLGVRRESSGVHMYIVTCAPSYTQIKFKNRKQGLER